MSESTVKARTVSLNRWNANFSISTSPYILVGVIIIDLFILIYLEKYILKLATFLIHSLFRTKQFMLNITNAEFNDATEWHPEETRISELKEEK